MTRTNTTKNLANLKFTSDAADELLTCLDCGFTKRYWTRRRNHCPQCYSRGIIWTKLSECKQVLASHPAVGQCRCGCGGAVTRYYKPGHGARHVAALKRDVLAGLITPNAAYEQLPTPALVDKLKLTLHSN